MNHWFIHSNSIRNPKRIETLREGEARGRHTLRKINKLAHTLPTDAALFAVTVSRTSIWSADVIMANRLAAKWVNVLFAFCGFNWIANCDVRQQYEKRIEEHARELHRIENILYLSTHQISIEKSSCITFAFSLPVKNFSAFSSILFFPLSLHFAQYILQLQLLEINFNLQLESADANQLAWPALVVPHLQGVPASPPHRR